MLLLGNLSAFNQLNFIRVFGAYLLRNLIEDDLLQLLQNLTYHETTLHHAKQCERTALSLAKRMETLFPITERDIIMHLIVHLPQQMASYGPARSYWTFATERYWGVVGRSMKIRRQLGGTLGRC